MLTLCVLKALAFGTVLQRSSRPLVHGNHSRQHQNDWGIPNWVATCYLCRVFLNENGFQIVPVESTMTIWTIPNTCRIYSFTNL